MEEIHDPGDTSKSTFGSASIGLSTTTPAAGGGSADDLPRRMPSFAEILNEDSKP